MALSGSTLCHARASAPAAGARGHSRAQRPRNATAMARGRALSNSITESSFLNCSVSTDLVCRVDNLPTSLDTSPQRPIALVRVTRLSLSIASRGRAVARKNDSAVDPGTPDGDAHADAARPATAHRPQPHPTGDTVTDSGQGQGPGCRGGRARPLSALIVSSKSKSSFTLALGLL